MLCARVCIVVALLLALDGCRGQLPSVLSDSVAAPVPVAAVASQRNAIEVAFSPGKAETLVVGAITSAQYSIEVAAYSFTSRPIADALLAAKVRGVGVRIVADKSQRTARYTSVRYLAGQGIPVRIDSRYAIMHNKFMVIDDRTVQTGSFNYTRSAQMRNAENAIVIAGDRAVAARYAQEWQRLWDESEPLAASASR